MTADPAPAAPLSLGFLSPHNPHDRTAFSGTAWSAARALGRQAGIRLRVLGPHIPPGRFDRLLRRRSAPIDTGALDLDGLDAVLGLVASPLLDRLSRVRPGLPLFHVTDATPAFLREAYGWAIPPGADTIETRLAARAARVIYSSRTMAARAPADLRLPGLAPAAVPFGVNLEELPGRCPEKPSLNRLNLLFVGLDWARKGGDVAVAALNRLNADRPRATLNVVGRCPTRYRDHPEIVATGFVNKSSARGRARLSALYRDAHLLVLPSRGDCTPMVVAEAMAHGTPVLATDTGGIAEQVGGGGAGRVLPPCTPPEDWAEAILSMTADRDGYKMASDAAFDRAHGLFSWDSWAAAVGTVVRQDLRGRDLATDTRRIA